MTEFEKKLLIILEKQMDALFEIATKMELIEAEIRMLGHKIY